ncbi:hypothetical protein C8F01DRAFT_1089241 [Mycena amicta]|nr:hypothetical protein C8F01DRAFT_1089241 [Mycena amicta]
MSPERRSNNTIQADADAKKYEIHLGYSKPIALDSCPRVQILVEDANGGRQDVTEDSSYAEVKKLARTVLGHLASLIAESVLLSVMRMISNYSTAKKALEAKLGHGRGLVAEDIIHYLVQKTPTIVIKNLQNADSPIVWGLVSKGYREGADANEVFISEELTNALRQSQPQHLTQAEFELQRAWQTFLWSTTLLHETCHALTKFYFSATTVVPKIGFLVANEEGHADSGRTFELQYLRFLVECAWEIKDFDKTDRMWRISHLFVGNVCGTCKILNVQRIQESFSRDLMWCPNWESSANPPPNLIDTHIRYEIGQGGPVVEEDVAVDEEEEDGAPRFVYATTTILKSARSSLSSAAVVRACIGNWKMIGRNVGAGKKKALVTA